MTRHTIANLFVSTSVALAALILIVGVVGAKSSAPLLTEPPVISSAPHRATTSTLALPQVITTLHPFLGMTPPAWPIRIGIDPRSGYIYIVCEENNLILILRGTQVVSWIDRGADWWVPESNQHAIAVNPINGYAYIGNIFRNEISILSGRQLITTAAYPFPYPAGHILEANPLNGYVYAAAPDNIVIFSGTQTIATIPIEPFEDIVGFGVNSNTGIVYAARRLGCIPCPPDNLHGLVTLISGTQVITSIAMSTTPYAIGVNSATGYVYLLDMGVNPDYSYTKAIKVLSGTQVITVAGSEQSSYGHQDGNIRANPATGYIYAADADDLTILSGTRVITNLPLSIGPIGISPASGYVYLGSKVTNTVMVMSGTEIIGTLPVGSIPSDIQVNPQTGLIYITGYDDQSITVLREWITPDSSPSGLLSPVDDITLDFSEPVITATIGVEISPTLPHTLAWSTGSDRAVIAHEPFEPGTRYTLRVQPGGQATSGLTVMEKSFDYLYLPIHLFLPLINQ